jgi:RND family efflux transporter MFP subunit
MLRLYGQTVAGRKVELRSLVAGEIVAVSDNLREGAPVQAGEVLLEIDQFDYQGALEEARANLAEAEAKLGESAARIASERDALARASEQLELARRDLERARELRGRGTLSERAVDDRVLVVSQREQAVEQRTNNLRIEEAREQQQRAANARLEWRVRQAERNLADTKLTAPFDAYVQGVAAQVGRTLNANDVIATLLDRTWIEVRFSLSDQQFGRILEGDGDIVGRPVSVNWRIGSEPVTYAGTIERIAPQIASESGGVDVYARLRGNSHLAALRSGAFVEVEIPDRVYRGVARLPDTAIYGTDRIYVINDGRLAARQVDVVGYDGADVLVRGELTDGERVIVSRISEAGEGLLVEEVGQ